MFVHAWSADAAAEASACAFSPARTAASAAADAPLVPADMKLNTHQTARGAVQRMCESYWRLSHVIYLT